MMILFALLTTNVTAYAFSQISEIVREEDNKKKSLSNMLNGINLQMQLGGLGMNLQQKVRKYFQYIYYRDQQILNIQEQLVEKLPYNLKEEVLYDLNKEFISDAQIFQDLSPQCLKYISLSIKQKQLLPDEILIQEKQLNECLYYVTLGSLEILYSIGEKQEELIFGKSQQRLKKKQTFGYEGFLFRENSPYCIKSSGLSVVSYIENSSLLQILKQFPDDYEKFCFIQDRAIYGNLYARNYKLNCISCQQSDHSLKQCPYLTISAKHRQQKSTNDRLGSHKRSNKRWRNSLDKIDFIQQRAMEALVNNDESVFMDALYVYNNTDNTEQDDDDDDQETTSSSNSSSLMNTKRLENQILSNKDIESKKINSQNNSEANSVKKQINYQQSNLILDSETTELLKSTCNNIPIEDFEQTNNDTKSPCVEKLKEVQTQKNMILESPFEQKSVKFLLKKNSPFYSKFNEDKEQQFPNEVLKKYFEKSNQKTIKNQQSLLDRSTHSILKVSEQPEIKLLKQTFEQRQRIAQTRLKQAEKQINDRIQVSKQLTNHQFVAESPAVQPRRRSSTICESNEQMTQNNSNGNQYLTMISLLTSKNQQNLSKVKKIKMSKEIIRQKLERNQSLNNPTLFQAEEHNQAFTHANSLNHISTTQFLTNSKDKVSQIYEDSSEYQIRCQVNLQDIDKLVVRKQFQLQQQKNLIENFIEVPDNEIDIDQVKTYQHYFKRYNVKHILQKIKMIQDEKLNLALIQRKKKKLSFKKSQNNILLNFKQNPKRNSKNLQQQNPQSISYISQQSNNQIKFQNNEEPKQERKS